MQPAKLQPQDTIFLKLCPLIQNLCPLGLRVYFNLNKEKLSIGHSQKYKYTIRQINWQLNNQIDDTYMTHWQNFQKIETTIEKNKAF